MIAWPMIAICVVSISRPMRTVIRLGRAPAQFEHRADHKSIRAFTGNSVRSGVDDLGRVAHGFAGNSTESSAPLLSPLESGVGVENVLHADQARRCRSE